MKEMYIFEKYELRQRLDKMKCKIAKFVLNNMKDICLNEEGKLVIPDHLQVHLDEIVEDKIFHKKEEK